MSERDFLSEIRFSRGLGLGQAIALSLGVMLILFIFLEIRHVMALVGG